MMYFDDFARFLEIAFWVVIGLVLLLMALALVEYVLNGIALSRMARNAGHPSPFLAWIPVANDYLLGSLCERSQLALTGKQWRFSVILPVLDLVSILGGGIFTKLFRDTPSDSYDLLDNTLSAGSGLLRLAATVVMIFALYQLFRDYAPGKETLYTVLAVILGGLGRAILLMTLRDRIPLSAQSQSWGGWGPAGGYPPQGGPYQTPPPYYGPQGPAPWQSGSGTTGWAPPPNQGEPGTTGWAPPPNQGETGTAGWAPPPAPPESGGQSQPPEEQN